MRIEQGNTLEALNTVPDTQYVLDEYKLQMGEKCIRYFFERM